MTKKPWVTLPVDWRRARALGAERQALREASAFGTSTRLDPENRAHENCVGMAAELGFGDVMGMEPPPFRPELECDPGYEYVTVIGRFDVKGAANEPWFIGVSDTALAKEPGADFYVLLHCPLDVPWCEVKGFATRAEMQIAPHVPHVLDPLGTHVEWQKRNSPGRWLPVTAEPPGRPIGIHDATPLIRALRMLYRRYPC